MKILVASHKIAPMPADQSLYQPILVGAINHQWTPEGYWRDDTGENMSVLNLHYSELTALYWAKYNLQDEDVVGLMHYRRYFGRKRSHDLGDVLNRADIEAALADVDVLVPKARNYFIENQEKHYLNAHNAEPYWEMVAVLKTYYPEYVHAFMASSASTKAHLFNMSIMRQADFQAYTDFLFGVLDHVKARIPYDTYEGEEARVFGFLAERLMDAWLLTEKKTIKEMPLVQTTKTNWVNKGYHFLKRKYTNGNKKTHFS